LDKGVQVIGRLLKRERKNHCGDEREKSGHGHHYQVSRRPTRRRRTARSGSGCTEIVLGYTAARHNAPAIGRKILNSILASNSQ
jgi:hypothetical protein